MKAFSTHDLLEDVAKKTAALYGAEHPTMSFASLSDMRKWVSDPSIDNALLSESGSATAAEMKDKEVIELLNEAITESRTDWQSEEITRAQTPTDVRPFATIAEVSRALTLNEKQHWAVHKIGLALLTRWKNVETMAYTGADMNDALRRDQLRLYLGEGGTGKSRIVEAIETLCRSWGHSDSLIKTALTRKAATIIGGRTLVCFLLKLRRETSIDVMMNLSIIVMNEVSMMKKTELVQLDKLLRQAKRVPDVLFGGVHVVLVGDFLQLPPVGADPIYKNHTGKKDPKVVDIVGFQIRRSFEDVIVLGECVHFQNDPDWGRGCHEARLGVWTPEFIRL